MPICVLRNVCSFLILLVIPKSPIFTQKNGSVSTTNMFYIPVSEVQRFAIDEIIRVKKEELVTCLWFQISMCEAELMHCLETLKDLSNHHFHLEFRQFCIHMSLQIAMFEVFHGDEDVVWVFEPSLECHKKFFVLKTVSYYYF